MKFRIVKLLLFCLAINNSTFGQFDTVFKVPKELQVKVMDSIVFQLVFSLQKDSISFYVSKLKNYAIEGDDYQILIYSELMRMRKEHLFKNFNPQKESIRFNQLLNIAREKKDTVMMCYMSHRFGDILRDNFKFAMAISYYLIANKYLPYLKNNLYNFDRTNLEMHLATFYYHLEEYPKALDILSNSVASKSIDHSGMSCYDIWSQVCLKMKDYECSKKMIQKAYSIYLVSDTLSWWFNGWNGIFKGNLGKIEFYQKNYNQAIALFIEGIRITKVARMHNNIASFGNLLAQCYIQTHQEAKAVKLLPIIHSSTYQTDDPQHYVDYYKLSLILSNSMKQANRNLEYFDSLNYYNIKLQDRKNIDFKIKEELALEISKQELFQDQMQKKIKQQERTRNYIIGLVIILGMAVSITIYRKQKQLSKQKNLTKEIEEKSAKELAIAKEELSQFKEFLLEKNTRILNLESTIQGIDAQNNVEELKDVVILTDEDWKKFKILFERVHPGYLERLKINYPQLTQGEIRYFLLIKLDLSNKEMASIMGVSPGALRTLKSRIQKKLNLSEAIELIDLIH